MLNLPRKVLLSMLERKCDFPIVVKRSNGRAVSPERYFKIFKSNNRCAQCPKSFYSHGVEFLKETSELPTQDGVAKTQPN